MLALFRGSKRIAAPDSNRNNWERVECSPNRGADKKVKAERVGQKKAKATEKDPDVALRSRIV